MRISDWSSDVCSSDLACASLVSALCIAASASPSLAPASLKEGCAIGAPRLPVSLNLRFGDDVEQRPGQHIGVERIGPGGGDEFAELLDLLRRSEEHTSELQSLMRISYAVFCLKKKKTNTTNK